MDFGSSRMSCDPWYAQTKQEQYSHITKAGYTLCYVNGCDNMMSEKEFEKKLDFKITKKPLCDGKECLRNLLPVFWWRILRVQQTSVRTRPSRDMKQLQNNGKNVV